MGFTFSARAILALGKELISSDEVAIYELIKNSVDAQSPRIALSVQSRLKFSDYSKAIRWINSGRKRKEIANLILNSLDHISEDNLSGIRVALKQIKTKRLKRWLRNLYSKCSYIQVRDIGDGMSLDELRTVYLRIGTDSRRKQNLKGAKNLGDKGIGRLSTMRLGRRLFVKTARKSDRYWNLLEVDWARFMVEGDVDVQAIKIEPTIGEEKLSTDAHGTTIRISDLGSDWSQVRFADMLQGKIARMVDPFERGKANRLIVARYNRKRILVPSIRRELLEAAHAVCHANFRIDGKTPVLDGEIHYRHRHKSQRLHAKGAEIGSVTKNAVKRRAKRGHAAFSLVDVDGDAFARLGNFSLDIYWYNRRVVQAIEGLTDKATETRREISNWSGGPMVFRYGFRVLPYGDPNDDWLGLDEAAFGLKGFKLNRQQVIGRVNLETSHMDLAEQTNREGTDCIRLSVCSSGDYTLGGSLGDAGTDKHRRQNGTFRTSSGTP